MSANRRADQLMVAMRQASTRGDAAGVLAAFEALDALLIMGGHLPRCWARAKTPTPETEGERFARALQRQ